MCAAFCVRCRVRASCTLLTLEVTAGRLTIPSVWKNFQEMSLKTSESREGGLAANTAAESAPRDDSQLPHVLVKSEDAGVQLNFGDLWAYRELLYFLTWRDVKVRYKQTLMGV